MTSSETGVKSPPVESYRTWSIRARAPSEATQEELQERQGVLEQILRSYDEQMNDQLRIQEARQRHADTTRANSEWTGFTEPPPYSILVTDQLWDAVYSLRLTVEGLQSQLDLLSLRFERARQALTGAEERLRQASEKLEAVNDAQAARQRWIRDLEDVRKRAAAVRVSAADCPKPGWKKSWRTAGLAWPSPNGNLKPPSHPLNFLKRIWQKSARG